MSGLSEKEKEKKKHIKAAEALNAETKIAVCC